jgi:hypothetical protein
VGGIGKSLVLVAVAASVALSQRSARAQPGQDSRAVEARKACAAGEVDKGIRILADILATTEDITAVFNMGRCYQQNGQPTKAIQQFREYLRKGKDLGPDDRKETEGLIKEAEAEEKTRSGQGLAPTASRSLASAGTVAETGQAATDSEASGKRRLLRWTGIGVASAGVLSIGTAVYFGLHAKSLEEQNEKPGNTFNKSSDDAGKRASTFQYVFYGVGAAALAAGAVLYYLGWEPGEQVAVLPSVTPHGAGAVLRIRL